MIRETICMSDVENSQESKLRVAEILSSMQSGTEYPVTTSSIPFTSTGLTPLLTPSTLANIEQTFKNLTQSANLNNQNQRESGFVPPIINTRPQEGIAQLPAMVQIKTEAEDDTDLSSYGSESDYGSAPKRARYSGGNSSGGSSSKAIKSSRINIPDIDPNTYLVSNSRRPTGPRRMKKNDNMSHEEEERLKQRRERNKQAAAKCRKRRDDVTNVLIAETENLEGEKQKLEDEIQQLLQQKEKFEFLLQAHQNTCPLTRQHVTPVVSQPLHHQALNLTSAAARMTPFEEAQLRAVSRSQTPQNIVTIPTTSNRPSSLAIASNLPSRTAVTEALGIPISTPSAGALFGFEAMAEGHTGLTPLTGMPSTSIATPTTQSQSCSGEVQTATRKSTESSSSNELASPTTLIAL